MRESKKNRKGNNVSDKRVRSNYKTKGNNINDSDKGGDSKIRERKYKDNKSIDTDKDTSKMEERKVMLDKLFQSDEYKPIRFRDIVSLLQVPKSSKHELREILDNLISQGKIILDDKGRYKTPEDSVKTGMFSGTQKGFGFVIIEGEAEDIFIPEVATKGAIHGDTVLISLSDEK